MAIDNETAADKARRAAEDAARRAEADDEGNPTQEEEAAAKKAAEEKAFNDRLNDFYTKREKRTLSQFEKMLDNKLAALAGASAAPAAGADDEEEEEEDDEPAPAAQPTPAAQPAPAKQDVRAKKALKKLAEAEKRIAEKEKALKEESDKRQATELRSATLAALNAAECSNVKGALAVLKEDGRIGRDKDGNMVFLTPDGDYVDEESLEDGIKKWLASDEGKEYAKPRGVGGSGAEPTKGASSAPRRSSKTLSKQERLAKAGETLMRFARGGVGQS
jgi:hypothetical protein